MALRGSGSCYVLRECLPGHWGGCGSKAVSYVCRTWTHIFEGRLTSGHARQHSTALPKILFATVCGTRAQGRSLLRLTHLHHRPRIHLCARHESHMHLYTHASTQAKNILAHTHTQAACKHSTGLAHHMWAFAKRYSPPQRTSVK